MTSNIPSSHLPPTPSMSGGFTVKESSSIPDGPDFALPPAALTAPRETTTTSRKLKDRPLILPASPTSPGLLPLRHEHEHEPTPSRPGKSGTGTKRRLEDLDLPPPPTRTRKIIQVKPKDESAAKGKQGKEEKTSTSSTANSNSKKKQSSSTAGRKTARKTAHSLIERRRRSKMNEEFGTLKDMIPACRGEEMHKLAILQAGIDYVNYLEQCIQDLKVPHTTTMAPPPGPPSPTSPDGLIGMVAPGGSTSSASVSPELAPSAGYGISPSFSPHTVVPSQGTIDFGSALSSPALGPSQPEDMRRLSSHQSVFSANTSPAILPRVSNASSAREDADIDHQASAALLMLNRDRRGAASSGDEVNDGSKNKQPGQEQRKRGMSVKDLLIS